MDARGSLGSVTRSALATVTLQDQRSALRIASSLRILRRYLTGWGGPLGWWRWFPHRPFNLLKLWMQPHAQNYWHTHVHSSCFSPLHTDTQTPASKYPGLNTQTTHWPCVPDTGFFPAPQNAVILIPTQSNTHTHTHTIQWAGDQLHGECIWTQSSTSQVFSEPVASIQIT